MAGPPRRRRSRWPWIGGLLLLLCGLGWLGRALNPAAPVPPAATGLLGTFQASPLGSTITAVSADRTDLTIDYTIPEAGSAADTRHTARVQARNYLLTAAGLPTRYDRVHLRGTYQGTIVVSLQYPAATVTGTDWALGSSTDRVYELASDGTVAPAFRAP